MTKEEKKKRRIEASKVEKIKIGERIDIPNVKIKLHDLHRIMGNYKTWDFIQSLNFIQQCAAKIACIEVILPDLLVNEEESYDREVINTCDFMVYNNTDLPENDLRISLVRCTAYFIPIKNEIQYRLTYKYDIFVTDDVTRIIEGDYKECYQNDEDMPFGFYICGYGYYGRRCMPRNRYAEISQGTCRGYHMVYQNVQSEKKILNIINKSAANKIGLQEIISINNNAEADEQKINEYEYVAAWGKNHAIKNMISRPRVLRSILMADFNINNFTSDKNVLNLSENILNTAETYAYPENMLKIMPKLCHENSAMKDASPKVLNEITDVIFKFCIDIDDFVYIALRTNCPFEKLAETIHNVEVVKGVTKSKWVKTWAEFLRMTDV